MRSVVITNTIEITAGVGTLGVYVKKQDGSFVVFKNNFAAAKSFVGAAGASIQMNLFYTGITRDLRENCQKLLRNFDWYFYLSIQHIEVKITIKRTRRLQANFA